MPVVAYHSSLLAKTNIKLMLLNDKLIPLMVKCTRYNNYVIKVCQWLATDLWFSPCTPVFITNKTDYHDITEILLKVALNTITLTLNTYVDSYYYKKKMIESLKLSAPVWVFFIFFIFFILASISPSNWKWLNWW